MKYLRLLAITAIIALAGYWAWQHPAWRGDVASGGSSSGGEITGSSGKAAIGGAFALTDPAGNTVRDSDFRGKYLLVFFGFTRCPDICPLSLATLSETMTALGDSAASFAPVFISVDPEHDTPQVVGKFIAQFDSRIIGLTGSADAVRSAEEAYKVYAAKVEKKDAPEGYMMDHSGYLYLMNPKGEYVTHFSHDIPAAELTQKLRAYVQP